MAVYGVSVTIGRLNEHCMDQTRCTSMLATDGIGPSREGYGSI